VTVAIVCIAVSIVAAAWQLSRLVRATQDLVDELGEHRDRADQLDAAEPGPPDSRRRWSAARPRGGTR
jgi:hypothetical protein